MTFFEAIAASLGKYADFDGRASRPEFWWFALFLLLASAAAGVIDQSNGYRTGGPVSGLLSVATILPSVAVGARRLHDIGKSGLWQLIAFTGFGIILLIYWWCQPATDAVITRGGEA